MYLGPLFHGVDVGIFEHFNPSKVHPKRFGHRKLESEEVLPLLPWPLRGCRWGLSSIAHILISANGSKLPWFPYNNCSYCWWFRNPANQLRLVVYPTIYRVLYISGGAGFLPSTVVAYIRYLLMILITIGYYKFSIYWIFPIAFLPIIGYGHQPNNRGFYTHYKDFPSKVGLPPPI